MSRHLEYITVTQSYLDAEYPGPTRMAQVHAFAKDLHGANYVALAKWFDDADGNPIDPPQLMVETTMDDQQAWKLKIVSKAPRETSGFPTRKEK